MSSYGRGQRPALKSSVDLQLQTAFSEGNWPTVIKLAEKRAKTHNDPYFEAVKVCAESQLDGLADRSAVALAIDGLVKKGVAPLDFHALELYEWALRDSQPPLDYATTLGVLRSRWVKANPRNVLGCTMCLQMCLRSWDLVNAQQIAAVLDKSSNANDRSFMYWSILLTHLLSISPQCPEDQRKIYGMLALKQLDKAAEIAESRAAENGDKSSSTPLERDMREEEEFLLYSRVLLAHGSRDEFVKRMQSANVGALRQFRQGRKELLLETLGALEGWGRWDAIYDLCRQALETTEEAGSPSMLASDLRVWLSFIAAASKRSNEEASFAEVQSLLQRFVSAKSKFAQMYVKTIGIALLETTFHMPPSMLPLSDGQGLTPRLAQLCLYLEQHHAKPSVFDDTKSFVERLSFTEANYLLKTMLPKLMGSDTETLRAISLKVLGYKFRYFLNSCPQTLAHFSPGRDQTLGIYRCKFCDHAAKSCCENCLEDLISDAAKFHKELSSNSAFFDTIPSLDRDPRVDLSLVAAMSLLKLARITDHVGSVDIDIRRCLQAAVLLDSQFQRTPNVIPLRLLLLLLYLRLGCASLAYRLWTPLDVKRTIQDALSPLFFDRISSISPLLFHGGKPLMEPLRSYYASILRNVLPVRIWDAFSARSYSSVLGMAEFNDRLRSSCTRVMTTVEERRAARAFGARVDELDDSSLFAEVTDKTVLVSVIDYGSLPNFEYPQAPALAKFLRVGPDPSNTRSHLGLLAEQYLDLITFKPAKEYKPAKPGEAALRDQAFVLESLASLSTSFAKFLHLRETPFLLTPAEEAYYTIVSLLSSLLATSLATTRSEAAPSFTMLATSLKSTLASLRSSLLSTPPSPLEMSAVFYSLIDQHTMSMLRESAIAIKHSAAYVLAHHERETARDRSGKPGLHKEVVAEMRTLEALGTKTLAEVKDHIKQLKEKLGEPGWLDRMEDWTLGREAAQGDDGGDALGKAVYDFVDGTPVVEEWAGRVLDSWREGVKGWGIVRME